MVTAKRFFIGLQCFFLLLSAAEVSTGGLLSKQKNMGDTKKFVIDETAWLKLMEEPAGYFLRAKESLLKDIISYHF